MNLRRNPGAGMPQIVFKDIPEAKLKDIISKYAQMNPTEQDLFDAVYGKKLKKLLKKYKNKLIKEFNKVNSDINSDINYLYEKLTKQSEINKELRIKSTDNVNHCLRIEKQAIKDNTANYKQLSDLIGVYFSGVNERLKELENKEDPTLLEIFKLFLTVLLNKFKGI